MPSTWLRKKAKDTARIVAEHLHLMDGFECSRNWATANRAFRLFNTLMREKLAENLLMIDMV